MSNKILVKCDEKHCMCSGKMPKCNTNEILQTNGLEQKKKKKLKKPKLKWTEKENFVINELKKYVKEFDTLFFCLFVQLKWEYTAQQRFWIT